MAILINKDKKITQINDDIIKSATDHPIISKSKDEIYFLIQCPNFKDLSLHELFQSFFTKGELLYFNNDIYYISLNKFAE